MKNILSGLTIKTKVIACAAIGFAMMLATALAIFRGDAGVNEAIERGSRLRDQQVLALRAQLAGNGTPRDAARESAARAAIERVGRDIAAADKAAVEARTVATWTLIVVSVAGMVVFALLATWIIVSVLKPVFAALGVVHTIARGDLTARIEGAGTDETGQLLAALGEMNDNLAATVARVRQAADSVQGTAHDLGSGNADLSREAEQQAVSLEEASSATEQMSSSVAMHAETSREASTLAQAAATLASSGGQMVASVVDRMNTIQASSSRIADIVAIIDGIAFQTNILALNAAVEAARAGEQGRGFAVVASEVRSLAQRSAAAAQDIRGVIRDSLDMIHAGTALAEDAGGKMHDIVNATGQVRDLMDRLAGATREQSAGLAQVATVVGHLDTATQRYSHVVAQLNAAAEALGRQSDDLVSAVSAFRIAETAARDRETAAVTLEPAASRATRMPALAGARMRTDDQDGWARF